MNRPHSWTLLSMALLMWAACSQENESSTATTTATGTGTTTTATDYGPACELYASLAAQLGCSAADTTESWCLGSMSNEPTQCADEMLGWVECAAEHPDDCLCEVDDGHINCEGTFKPSEGSASCLAIYAAFSDCIYGGVGGSGGFGEGGASAAGGGGGA